MNTKILIAALTAAVSVTVLLSACGSSSGDAARTGSQTPRTTIAASPTTIARPSAVVDKLVAVHGTKLHVHCVGAGGTTVVLIAGFNDDGGNWSKVEPAVAKRSRVCRYDRFGNGTSDAPPAPQTFATQAADLHALTFTSMFPTEVRGLLLLDASPPVWNSTICSVTDNGSEAARSFVGACAEQQLPANNRERLDGPRAFAELGAIRSLGDVPMVVATAAHRSYPDLAPGEETHIKKAWGDGQAHWVSLSTAAQLVAVDRTGHHIQLDRPDVVIDQIGELLQ
jgi:pimeloyl-ACP methyl ester carboxylesterase